MKLFGGKKGDDKAPAPPGAGDDEGYYDSPQETVSLSGPRNPPGTTAPSAKPAVPGAKPATTAAAKPAPAAPASASPPPARAIEDDEPERPSYGIQQAIELMRALPFDQNPELVVQVIKTTLESLKVKVPEIIADADRRTKDLEDRVSNLKRAIADFEKEIETRREEIARLEADHKETTAVRGRLELAEKAQRAQAAAGAKVKTG